MSKEIVIPAYLKDSDVEGADALVSESTALPRISLKGRQFRFKVMGEEIKKTPGPIDVVILGVQPERGCAKTYYRGKYNPNDTDPPTCSSTDGVRPDSWVEEQQADSCALCNFSKWGSATSVSGGKAKACRDSKRLMVVEPDDIDGTMFILNVTVSSLSALSEYGRKLVAHSMPMAAAITAVHMVDSDYPQIEFEYNGNLKEAEGQKAIAISTKKSWVTALKQQDEVANKPKPKLENKTGQSTTVAPKESVDKTKSIDDVIDSWAEDE